VREALYHVYFFHPSTIIQAVDPQNPSYAEAVEGLFRHAPFISELGLRLQGFGPGWCETVLEVEPRHLQQDGWLHAGVQATVADHTAGAAGISLVPAGHTVVTAEFKINLLRPARGERLRCRSQVLRPGRRLIVVESELVAEGERSDPPLTAKATVTLAVVDLRQEQEPT
jgi:uncharacterized protein (TIGR00369 family)